MYSWLQGFICIVSLTVTSHVVRAVTCEAPEGWEGCGRLEILRALLGFCDLPMGNAPPQHVAGGWCDPPSFVPLQPRR